MTRDTTVLIELLTGVFTDVIDVVIIYLEQWMIFFILAGLVVSAILIAALMVVYIHHSRSVVSRSVAPLHPQPGLDLDDLVRDTSYRDLTTSRRITSEGGSGHAAA